MQIERLVSSLEIRVAELEQKMSAPELSRDPKTLTELARQHRRMNELRVIRDKWYKIHQAIRDNEELSSDPELGELATAELPDLRTELERLEVRLKSLIVPEQPEDVRNAVLEIRAGTGGEEAALFASDLFNMYSNYFERRHWKRKVITSHFSDLGGAKEIIVAIEGEGAYGRLKWESGVHRVQRIPITEASGRIHTSAATVAVLPAAEEIDIQIDPSDLRIDTFRSSGPGGQHVNKTESAVRITHLPTGMVVSCQDEKSQMKNKAQALKVLRARLFQRALDEEQDRRASQRRSQVSTGDRSAKIRTYNFPQSRLTDHRGPITSYQLEEILAGNLDLLLDQLIEHFDNKKLEELIQEGKI